MQCMRFLMCQMEPNCKSELEVMGSLDFFSDLKALWCDDSAGKMSWQITSQHAQLYCYISSYGLLDS